MLIVAIRNRNYKAVEVLCVCGADANVRNRKGVTPIAAASHQGIVDIMQVLLRHGALVNAVNASGSTPLIQAAHFGHYDAVSLLLANGANPDFANMKGTTSLMRSAQEGHTLICKALLETKLVNVNDKNHEGMNALMLASQRGHGDTVRILVEHGAAIDERTSQGSTALMLACKRGHEEVVKVLISMGAEIYIRDGRGRSAWDTAVKREHDSLCHLLSLDVQLSMIRDLRWYERTQDLMLLREAYSLNRLQLSPNAKLAIDLYKTEKMAALTSSNGSDTLESPCQPHSLKERLTGKPFKHHASRKNWHWVVVLYNCFSLPNGVFEHIVEYIPFPRLWEWQLSRVQFRMMYAPQVVMIELCKLINEILQDTCMFRKTQHNFLNSNLMVYLARSSDVASHMIEKGIVREDTLMKVIEWSDVQSLLSRSVETASDPYQLANEPGSNNVVFDTKFVRDCLEVAVQLLNDIRIEESYKQALINSGFIESNSTNYKCFLKSLSPAHSIYVVKYNNSNMNSMETSPEPHSVADSSSDFRYNVNVQGNSNRDIDHAHQNMEEISDGEEYGDNWNLNNKEIDVQIYTDGEEGDCTNSNYLKEFAKNNSSQSMRLISMPNSSALNMKMHLSVNEWLGLREGGNVSEESMNVTDDL